MTDTNTPVLNSEPRSLKPCTKCGVIQPLDNFDTYFRRRENRREPRSWCRACMNRDARERYRRKHPNVRCQTDRPDGLRTCRVCQEVKPIDRFYPTGVHPNGKTYRRHTCDTCANRQVSEFKRKQRDQDPEAARQENREKARKYRERHGEKYREYQKEYQRQWVARNRERVRANRERYEERRRARSHQELPEVPPGPAGIELLPGRDSEGRAEVHLPGLCQDQAGRMGQSPDA